MAAITVRNLDEDVRTALRVRAAERGHSMEAEVRAILTAAVTGRPRSRNALMDLYWASRDGFDLEIAPRAIEEPSVDFAGAEFD